MRLAVAALGCLLLAPGGAQAAGPRIAPYQETVALLGAHTARARPQAGGTMVAVVDARRPLTGERTVLPMLAQTVDKGGRFWLRVRLPGRALGGKAQAQVGWISASNTLVSTTDWHILVDVRTRRMVVYRDGRRLRSYRAVVGKHSTPTPLGEYFVEENIRLAANQPGAPFALATSARSRVLQEFDGGPGQIAVHGLDNIGGDLGTAESHGCVRLADSAVTWLAARIQPGVPVTII